MPNLPRRRPVALSAASLLAVLMLTACGGGGGGGGGDGGGTDSPPSAGLTASPTSGTAPLAVSFTRNGSDDKPGLSCVLDFKDGSPTNAGCTGDVTHTYTTGGSYVATFMVTDSAGQLASKAVTITVNNPPTASFTASKSTCTVDDCTVAFDASASTDTDGSIATYSWNFGDSTTGTGKTVSHKFTSTGEKTVSLIVADNKGANSSSVTKKITVNPAPVDNAPTASFSSAQVARKKEVGFDASASADPEGKSLTYTWDFGDGTTGSGKTVSHAYEVAGKWNVQLTVKDPAGNSGSTTKTVVASVCPAPADGGVAVDGTKSTNFAINQPACPEFTGAGTQVFGLKSLALNGVASSRVKVYGDTSTGVARYIAYIATHDEYVAASQNGSIETLGQIRDKVYDAVNGYIDVESWFDRFNVHAVTGTSTTGIGNAVTDRVDTTVTNRLRAKSIIKIIGPYNMQHPNGILSVDDHEMKGVYPINRVVPVFDYTGGGNLYQGLSNMVTASVGGWKTRTDNGDGSYTVDSDDATLEGSRIGGMYPAGLGMRNGLKAGFELYPMGLDTAANVVGRLQGGIVEVCDPTKDVQVTEGSSTGAIYVKKVKCTIKTYTASQIEAMYASAGRVPNVSRSRKAHTTLPVFIFDETALPSASQMSDAVAGIQFEDQHINDTFTFSDRNGGQPLFIQSQTFGTTRTLVSSEVLRLGVTVAP